LHPLARGHGLDITTLLRRGRAFDEDEEEARQAKDRELMIFSLFDHNPIQSLKK
jgi:hypothetical protein